MRDLDTLDIRKSKIVINQADHKENNGSGGKTQKS
jgi:hypothetical protein